MYPLRWLIGANFIITLESLNGVAVSDMEPLLCQSMN